MKFLRYGPKGNERPGLLDSGDRIRDLSGIVEDIGGPALTPQGLDRLRALDPVDLPLVAGAPRLGSCIAMPGKILCLGINYGATAAALGLARPTVPAVSMKPPSAVCGAQDRLVLPPGSTATDWEVELGVVIGTPARRIHAEIALNHVAGYLLANDLAERTHQKSGGGDSIKGRGHDGFAPLGPYFLTAEEVPDPQALDLSLEIDGVPFQTGHTSDMIFTVAELITHLSEFMTLLPGDLILTGTPAGMGASLSPPRFLKDGETMRLTATGLGEQRTAVAAFETVS